MLDDLWDGAEDEKELIFYLSLQYPQHELHNISHADVTIISHLIVLVYRVNAKILIPHMTFVVTSVALHWGIVL